MIPARRGSKGLADKNLRPFDGEPRWRRAVRQGLRCTARAVLTTDTPDYVGVRGHADRIRAIKWALREIGTGCGITISGERRTQAVSCTRPELYAALKPAFARKARHIPGHPSFHAHFLVCSTTASI
ncbi:MAG: hypothetical protein WA948_12240 [Pontixanthobacter sp.]